LLPAKVQAYFQSRQCQAFRPERVDTYAAYIERNRGMAVEFARRGMREQALAGTASVIATQGYCCVCHRPVRFHTNLQYGFRSADGSVAPNWREHVCCPECGLNNRMRAAIHFFMRLCHPAADSRIYVTEQTTPLFTWLRARYSRVVGSEYLGTDVRPGSTNASGIRHETLTGLTFADSAFQFILSFDVFEHIPDYRAAFAECLRCLEPGGHIVFSVPFSHDSRNNIVRAEIAGDGTVVHHLPPEYHGDPLNRAGCLCFYHFGWALLDELRELGYRDAAAYFYWSEELGYLGGDQLLFLAAK
jgi:SAM-dependent methyltransferase